MPSWSDIGIPKQRFPNIPYDSFRARTLNGLFSKSSHLSRRKMSAYRLAGRPTKLTPEVQQIIVEILRNCGTRTAAAGRSHVHMATFLDWIHRGEQATSGKYYDFLCAVKDAEA
jgi:hypothetical protein